MSTNSEMATIAESMVSDIAYEDGCRVANPSEAEIENLRALLNNSVHEVHHLEAVRATMREQQA